MVELKYIIPAGKAVEYVADYCYIHKNTETKDDPTWVDPKDGTLAPQVPKYTDSAWVKQHILRSIRAQIVRGKKAQQRDELASVNADDVV